MKKLLVLVLIVVAIAVLSMRSARAAAAIQPQDAFFDDTGSIQEVRLRVSQRNWQTLKDHFEDDTYYPADFIWNGITVRNVGIRSRGNTTRNGIKPGIRVDFNRYLSNQQFLGMKAVALDNMYSDASLMREPITMKVFARFGLPAPRESQARLFVNDQFVGVYSIVESIDRTFIARIFGLAEGEVERGGYLYEYNWTRPYGFEDQGSDLEPYAGLFTPKTRETDSMTALFAPIRDMVTAINADVDDSYVQNLGQHLDPTEFMKYLAIENFLAEEDGLVGEWGLHNFYLYRFHASRPAMLLPWDKDKTFSAPSHPINYHLDTDELTKRAMTIPELRQIYYDTLLQCAAIADEKIEDDTRGWLEREVERENSRIAGSVAADPVLPWSLDEFQGEIDFMRTFARTRSPFVRCQVARATGSGDIRQVCSAPGSRARRR